VSLPRCPLEERVVGGADGPVEGAGLDAGRSSDARAVGAIVKFSSPLPPLTSTWSLPPRPFVQVAPGALFQIISVVARLAEDLVCHLAGAAVMTSLSSPPDQLVDARLGAVPKRVVLPRVAESLSVPALPPPIMSFADAAE